MADFEIQDWVDMNLGTIVTGTLAGAITGIKVQEDTDGKGSYKDNTVIRSDRNWKIEVSWELYGTRLDNPRMLPLDGRWVVRAYLEGWGQGAGEYDLDLGKIDVHDDVNKPTTTKVGLSTISGHETETAWLYTASKEIKPGDLPPTAKGNSIAGPYKLAATVTYEDPNGTPGDMAGFIELKQMIQIYDHNPNK